VKKLKIVISEDSVLDLEEIWFYTFTNWSLEQADRYHTLIIKEIDYLATNPHFGKKVDHLISGYRSTKVKSHYIFYTFSSTELEIIRILHESMDIPNRLTG
jgi:toxin ParE1/3/4